MRYWLGIEQDTELFPFDTPMDRYLANGRLIISFDTSREVLHGIKVPYELHRSPGWRRRPFDLKLTVWNESVALCPVSFEIWVMDDDSKGAWTKQLPIDERRECPTEMLPHTYHIFWSKPVALWSDEFLMVDKDGRVLYLNLCTKKFTYIPIESLRPQDYTDFVGYVNSIVSVMERRHEPESIENNCSDKDEDAMVVVDEKRESCRRRYSYSVWAIPPADVSHRTKTVMEVLRAEFGGPKIEPHIPVEGSIYMMSREDALNEFRSAPRRNIVAKVDQVVTRNYNHQCVSLLMDRELFATAETWCRHFGFYNSSMPYPRLLYGKLTEEERKEAREIVNVLDGGITSLSFPVTRYALCEIDYNGKSLKSWTKIAEIGH